MTTEKSAEWDADQTNKQSLVNRESVSTRLFEASYLAIVVMALLVLMVVVGLDILAIWYPDAVGHLLCSF